MMNTKTRCGRRALAALLLSFALVVGLLPLPSAGLPFGGGAQAQAVAADTASGAAGSTTGGTGSDSGTTAPTQPEQPKNYIADVSIWSHDTGSTLGYASSPSSTVAARITAKGGTLWFDNVAWWSDGTSVANQNYVTWQVSDPSIATISPGGALTAVGDGIVAVTATATQNTQDGAPLACTIYVEVVGQTDARYVSDIRIAGPDGAAFGGSYEWEADLSTAMVQLYALVDVYDPATGATQTYSTQNGRLSAQAPDIADVTWYVGDSETAAVDETTGLFRPVRYGGATVYCTSNGGFNNAPVTAVAVISTKDPEGGQQQDDYHPQNSIKIKAYYESDPPANLHDENDEHFVINKEYSLEDLEAMGTETATYTALGAGSYYTMTGRGVNLAMLLENAGVNIAGMAQLNFGTVDNIDRPVSASYIFGTDRYYFPNIDINSYAGAIQVHPILAFESNEIKNGSCEPNYTMSEATRFRLLFGSTPDGGTSQYQIKWINTLYVVLSGGPSVQPGGGDDPNSGNPASGGDGISNGNATGDGTGSGNEGYGTGAGMRGGTQGGQDVQGTNGESNAAEGAQGGSYGEGEQSADGGSANQGSYSVYQIPNPNDSNVEKTVDHPNPFKKYAGPLGAAAVLAGAAQVTFWYRRQVKPTPLT